MSGIERGASAGDAKKDHVRHGRGFRTVLGFPLAIGATLGILATASAGGAVHFRFDGATNSATLGWAVANLGDLDGDSVNDYAIGATLANSPTTPTTGKVFVRSGADGDLLYDLSGTSTNEHFGFAIASVGDVNGDLRPDFLISAPFADVTGGFDGYVRLISGSDGSTLRTLSGSNNDNFGFSVAGPGDVDGDGTPDLLVGAPAVQIFGAAVSLNPRVDLYSGSTGTLLHSFTTSAAAADAMGLSVSSLGDINTDGRPDLLIGSQGSAFVYSGADYSQLYRFNQESGVGGYFGRSVGAAGDTTGDSKPDIVVGDPYASPEGKTRAGRAYLYSGADGSLVRTWDGPTAEAQHGWSPSSAGDLNGDGQSEVVVGGGPGYISGPTGLTGRLVVYSGADGSEVFGIPGFEADDMFGFSSAAMGDITGDSRPDYLVGGPYTDPSGRTYAGSAYVLSAFTADTVKPTCSLARTGVNEAGKGFIEMTVQDSGSGLKLIEITDLQNAIVTGHNSFTPGYTGVVTVTATKIDQSKPSRIALRVTDQAGNVTSSWPLIVSVEIPRRRRRVVRTFRGVPSVERFLTVNNGNPGMSGIAVSVNGRRAGSLTLTDGATNTLDYGQRMRINRNNLVQVAAIGQPGSKAQLIIGNSNTSGSQARAGLAAAQTRGINMEWGP